MNARSGAARSAIRAEDHALILRRFAYGESSLVAHALTRRHGRIHFLAKGAYRPKSRYGGVLDVFDTLELRWSGRSEHEMQILEDAQLVERRHRIAHDLPRYRAALTVLELASLGALERAQCGELFDLCRTALDRLRDGVQPQRALVDFELGFLDDLGLAPALDACASCGGDAPPSEFDPSGAPRVDFSAAAGGRLCLDCARRAREVGARVGTLPVDVLALASALRRDPALAAPDEDLLERTRDMTARFVQYQLESQPKSYRVFLAAPHRNRRAAPPA